jgi:hypothetical protein
MPLPKGFELVWLLEGNGGAGGGVSYTAWLGSMAFSASFFCASTAEELVQSKQRNAENNISFLFIV